MSSSAEAQKTTQDDQDVDEKLKRTDYEIITDNARLMIDFAAVKSFDVTANKEVLKNFNTFAEAVVYARERNLFYAPGCVIHPVFTKESV